MANPSRFGLRLGVELSDVVQIGTDGVDPNTVVYS
jgi:hypothetical protein